MASKVFTCAYLKYTVSLSLQHFREDSALSEKLENLVEHANQYPQLTPNEKNAAVEVKNMHAMQKEAQENQCPVMELMWSKEPIHLVGTLLGHVIVM